MPGDPASRSLPTSPGSPSEFESLAASPVFSCAISRVSSTTSWRSTSFKSPSSLEIQACAARRRKPGSASVPVGCVAPPTQFDDLIDFRLHAFKFPGGGAVRFLTAETDSFCQRFLPLHGEKHAR